jgi:prevent-host-death family protein
VKVASLADVKSGFSAYVKESASGPVVVTRNGRPVAVLVAVRDEDELERLLLAHSPRLRAVLEAGRREIRAGNGIPHEKLWEQVPTAPAAVRNRPRKAPATTARRPRRKNAGVNR